MLTRHEVFAFRRDLSQPGQRNMHVRGYKEQGNIGVHRRDLASWTWPY